MNNTGISVGGMLFCLGILIWIGGKFLGGLGFTIALIFFLVVAIGAWAAKQQDDFDHYKNVSKKIQNGTATKEEKRFFDRKTKQWSKK